jgi:copper resistance protein B
MSLATPIACRAQNAVPMAMHDEPPPSTQGMDMSDSASHAMLLVDQFEFANGDNKPVWQAEAWYGNDSDKLWLRSESEDSRGRIQNGDAEMLWNHAVTAFWDTQLGVRRDIGMSRRNNTWAAFGVEGLAPYWITLEATGYIGNAGLLAARGRAEYTMRFSQRLMLQPEFEINLYTGKEQQERDGGHVSDAQFGLRLRYEITRQFAPYAGIVWSRRFGGAAAGIARLGQPAFDRAAFDRRFVAGVRFWF